MAKRSSGVGEAAFKIFLRILPWMWMENDAVYGAA
jgi:hypothetical protein